VGRFFWQVLDKLEQIYTLERLVAFARNQGHRQNLARENDPLICIKKMEQVNES